MCMCFGNFQSDVVLVVLLLLSTSCSLTFQVEDEDIITSEDEAVFSECGERGNIQYLLYKKDGKCYRANSQGPCGLNMILFPHPTSSRFGFCDCFDARAESEEEIRFLNDRNLTHCLPKFRGQVYVPERNRCHSVFDQGPCPQGKWLVLNGTFYPVCARNTCQFSTLRAKYPKNDNFDIDDPLSPRFVFALSSYSECYETMTRGYCAKSYELRSSSNHFIPQCQFVTPEYSRKPCPSTLESPPSLIHKLKCKPGSKYDWLTKCSLEINPR